MLGSFREGDSMTRDELERIRIWANDKIATGAEPPWAWYQYMKLREALDAIIAGTDAKVSVTLPVDSPVEDRHRGAGHLRLVDTCQPSVSQRRPSDPAVQLPM